MLGISVDVGSGVTKWKSGDALGSFPSAAGPFQGERFEVESFEHQIVEMPARSGGKAQQFVTGEAAESNVKASALASTLSRDWCESPAYLALLYRAIAEAFPKGLKKQTALALATGLPQAYFQKKRSTLVRLLTGRHAFRCGGVSYNLVIPHNALKVIPQAMGCYFEAVERDEELYQQSVGVIDVGTFTSGFAFVKHGRFVSHLAGGVECGLSDVVRSVQAMLHRTEKIEAPFQEVMRSIEREYILVRGKKIQLTRAMLQKSHVDPISDKLVKQLGDQWAQDAPFARILVAGGGARLFLPSLRRSFEHAEPSPSEELAWQAVVGGYYFYLQDVVDGLAA